MFKLKRNIQVDGVQLSGKYVNLNEILAECRYGDTLDDWDKIYSKVQAIDSLAVSMTASKYDIEQCSRKIRALLSDTGLLFPQTRERQYRGTNHSMQLSSRNREYFLWTARKTVDGRISDTKRVICFAKKVYEDRSKKYEGGQYPLTREQIESGLNLIMDGIGIPFSEVKLEADDRGYYLSNDDQKNEWLKTAYVCFGKDRVRVIPEFSEKMRYTVAGLFEFFAYILKECIWQEELYQECKNEGAVYVPVIDEAQKDDFMMQNEDFQNEDLPEWKKALPAMKQFLAPSIRHEMKLNRIKVADTEVTSLSEIFKKHLSNECGNEVTLNKKSENKKVADSAAQFFLRYVGRENSIFIDQPHIIFYIFRSPCYRNSCKRILDTRWPVKKVIRYACIEYPMPITVASLDADTTLFNGILDVCDSVCRANNIQFHIDHWHMWWSCMQQTVKCLSFQISDLIMVQDGFRKLLKYPIEGYRVLDNWLNERIMHKGPFAYASMWSTLLNRYCHLERVCSSKFQESCKSYKEIFVSPKADLSDVEKCIEPLCADIGWNKIHIVPTELEIEKIKDQVDEEKIQQILHTIKGHDEEKNNLQMLKLTLMEWVVLQHICEQSRRKLIECVVQLLSDTETIRRSK